MGSAVHLIASLSCRHSYISITILHIKCLLKLVICTLFNTHKTYKLTSVQESSIGGVIGTLARRASTNRRRSSQRGHSANEPPPDYPAVTTGRSFNLDELSDSDDDNAFIAEPPPDYDDLV